ncbi:hypothetical protein AGMMS50268_35400 [Spirochaetia bacterium]|nr:hypothetical protein AGMMS50268_35400 [Spirochaetia bacterium]
MGHGLFRSAGTNHHQEEEPEHFFAEKGLEGQRRSGIPQEGPQGNLNKEETINKGNSGPKQGQVTPLPKRRKSGNIRKFLRKIAKFLWKPLDQNYYI